MIALHPQFLVDDHGERTAAVIPMSEYQAMLDELEMLADIAAYDAAKAEHIASGAASVPYEVVRRELGLTG